MLCHPAKVPISHTFIWFSHQCTVPSGSAAGGDVIGFLKHSSKIDGPSTQNGEWSLGLGPYPGFGDLCLTGATGLRVFCSATDDFLAVKASSTGIDCVYKGWLILRKVLFLQHIKSESIKMRQSQKSEIV